MHKGPSTASTMGQKMQEPDNTSRSRNSLRSETSSSILGSLKSQNEIMLSHKTKVRLKIRPPGRISYEWEWDISKFDLAFPPSQLNILGKLSEKTKILRSKKITVGKDIGRESEWFFVLSECQEKLSWYLLLEKIPKSTTDSVFAAFSLQMVDGSGNILISKNRNFKEFKEGFRFGWNDIVSLEHLYQQKEVYLAENTLRLRIVFEMYADPKQWHNEASIQEKTDFATQMTSDMCKLRKSNGTADVHLQCDGKIFPVHKLILSARSVVFARMFDTPIVSGRHKPSNAFSSGTAGGDISPEKEQNVTAVSITDISANVLDIVLDYIYSGIVQPMTTIEMLGGVVFAADKFELGDLKSHCFNTMMNFVTEDNIGVVAVLAHRHKADKSVRVNITGYCVRNLAKLIQKKSFRVALKSEPDAFFSEEDDQDN